MSNAVTTTNYTAVWLLLLQSHEVVLTAHPNHHRAIRRGIVKRKDADKGYKAVCSVMNQKAHLVFESTEEKLTVKLVVKNTNKLSIIDI